MDSQKWKNISEFPEIFIDKVSEITDTITMG
jgi:hypothetical protein